MKKIKLIIADDHEVVRSGLRAYFQNEPDIIIVGEATDGEETLDLVAKRSPDVVLLDISMPKVNGIDATRNIKKNHPGVKVLILTIHDNEEFVFQLIAAGANGYVLKDAEKKEIIEGVRRVASGDRFFSSRISHLLIEEFIKRINAEKISRVDSHETLSPREIDVLRGIAQGLTNQQIAEKLFISPLTVHTHRNNLMQKLNIHDIAGLVHYAIQNGFVSEK
ncbi:MAG: response regulator [Bacteroidota bacterium]